MRKLQVVSFHLFLTCDHWGGLVQSILSAACNGLNFVLIPWGNPQTEVNEQALSWLGSSCDREMWRPPPPTCSVGIACLQGFLGGKPFNQWGWKETGCAETNRELEKASLSRMLGETCSSSLVILGLSCG